MAKREASDMAQLGNRLTKLETAQLKPHTVQTVQSMNDQQLVDLIIISADITPCTHGVANPLI